MNQPTITGSTDSNGLFTAKNPHSECNSWSDEFCYTDVNCSCYMKAEIEKLYPPLFCYNENNDLVKGVEGLEVKGPVWQYKCDPECAYEWDGCLDNSPEGYIAIATTREVYIAVQPTEKAAIANTEVGAGRSYYADYDERFFRLHAGIDSLISTYGVQDFVFAFLKYQDKMIDSNYKLQKTWK